MADACIGGKTAVNNRFGKNMVGSIYDPGCIVVHLGFLKSLDDRNFNNGMAEIIKMACILDYEFFL